jgi:ATP synthase protein I
LLRLRATCYTPGALSGQTGAGAYFALFSEIGFLLLVTTLFGALAGHWLDLQIGTSPIFLLVGFIGGAGIGTYGIYRMISRFLAKFD